MELEHGWHRAKTAEQARKRRRYLDEVFSIVPVEGFTAEMGVLAAKVDVGLKTTGVVVATLRLEITSCRKKWWASRRMGRRRGRGSGPLYSWTLDSEEWC